MNYEPRGTDEILLVNLEPAVVDVKRKDRTVKGSA